MVVRLGAGRGASALAPVAGRDVRLHADDRLELRLSRLLLELPGGVQVAVIGDRQGGLLELLGAPDQVIDPVGAVEERVFRVAMQMNEGHLDEDSGRDARRVKADRPAMTHL